MRVKVLGGAWSWTSVQRRTHPTAVCFSSFLVGFHWFFDISGTVDRRKNYRGNFFHRISWPSIRTCVTFGLPCICSEKKNMKNVERGTYKGFERCLCAQNSFFLLLLYPYCILDDSRAISKRTPHYGGTAFISALLSARENGTCVQ